jgi:hypothetical protein
MRTACSMRKPSILLTSTTTATFSPSGDSSPASTVQRPPTFCLLLAATCFRFHHDDRLLLCGDASSGNTRALTDKEFSSWVAASSE